jgi:protein-tyrosine-phosphatase
MGEQMTPQARTALRLCGETVGDTPRPSTLFTPGMVHEFDHIITMTHDHAREIGAYPNVRCLDTITGCGDIFDPYMYPVEVYVGVCKILQGALGILYNKLFTVNESN